MGCDFCASSIVPFSDTLCPTSPSLQRVAWASLPRLPGRLFPSDHRYYVPLRLPHVHFGFVRCSLSLPDTLLCPSFTFVSSLPRTHMRGVGFHAVPGFRLHDRISFYLPFSTGRHADLSSSRAAPMIACSGLRPRWRPGCLPFRTQACCLPLRIKRRLSPPVARKVILTSTTIPISGLNTKPAISLHPASDSRCRVCPRISLPACRLRFNRVGLALPRSPTGQHYRISRVLTLFQWSGFNLTQILMG